MTLDVAYGRFGCLIEEVEGPHEVMACRAAEKLRAALAGDVAWPCRTFDVRFPDGDSVSLIAQRWGWQVEGNGHVLLTTDLAHFDA